MCPESYWYPKSTQSAQIPTHVYGEVCKSVFSRGNFGNKIAFK